MHSDTPASVQFQESIAQASREGQGRGGASAVNHVPYLLAELRCASLRVQLLQADIDAVGLALKGGLITPDQALELLHDCDALRLVGCPDPDAEAS